MIAIEIKRSKSYLMTMKNNDKTSIVFLGSGPVAAKSLELIQEYFSVEAVITKPTTEREMSAVANKSPVRTVSTKKELDTLIDSSSFKSKVGVLIDFGIIVSQHTIDSFKKGIVNSHFSLLPELRGADPISFAILEGKQKTGVSLMMLVEAMDEGPLLAQAELELTGKETGPSLTADLIELSAKSLETVLPLWIEGEIDAGTQEDVTLLASKKATYTRKLTKSDGVINWSKSATEIDREIRAFIDWPKSRATIGDVECVITEAHVVPTNFGDPGDIEKSLIEDKILAIQAGDGYLCIDGIKPAGKKEMDAVGFLNGYRSRLNL